MIFIIAGKPHSGKKYLGEKIQQKGLRVSEYKTSTDIRNIDAIIADPDDINKIANDHPDNIFCIIKINTDNNMRKIYALRNVDKNHKIEAEQKFENEDKNNFEKYQAFDDATEAYRQNFNTFPDNITNIIEYQNDYTNASADDCIQFLMGYRTATTKMTGIVQDALSMNMFKQDSNHPNKIELQGSDPTKFVSLSNHNAFWSFMLNYICKSKRFEDIQ